MAWKTYIVSLERVDYAVVEVKARSEDEAINKALGKSDDVLFEEWTSPEVRNVGEKR